MPIRVLGPILTAVIASAVLVESMRLWEWRPGTPLGLNGDNLSVTTWVRTLIEFGPYADNPDLGAPFSQNLGWFPTADDVHFAILWLLGHVSGDAFTVTAIYFFIGFPLAALTMYWLARTEGLNVATSVLVGVLFTALPGHQIRYAHLFLAAYWVVPAGVWVALRLARSRPVFRPSDADGWGNAHPRIWAARSMIILVVVALGGVYYAAFALILMCVALALRMVAAYRRQRLYEGLAVIGIVACLTGTSLFLVHLRTLEDQVVGESPLARSPADSEAFGGKIIDLILPWPGHRFPALGQAARSYDAATQPTFEPSSLGVVGLVGCGVAVVVVLTAMLSARSMARRRPELWLYGVLAMVAIAFYTKDGLGALFALGVTPGIRTWLRLYVVIGLFGLLTVGRLVTVLGDRRRLTSMAAAVGLLVLGVLDQTSPGTAPNYEANRAQLAEVATMTQQLEAKLAPRCAVFQLPVVRFPDGVNPGTLGNYELDLPYLASSSDLRWSFGAIQGTAAAEWQNRLPAEVPQLTEDLAAADFCALMVDKRGYDQPSTILDELTSALGTPLASSSDTRLVTFDLRPRRASLVAQQGEAAVKARGDQVLRPFGNVRGAG